jgi:hypothetical protein
LARLFRGRISPLFAVPRCRLTFQEPRLRFIGNLLESIRLPVRHSGSIPQPKGERDAQRGYLGRRVRCQR